jgi:hypothetical protein
MSSNTVRAIVGGKWLALRPRRFISGERAPGTRWIGDWVSPRTDLDDVETRKLLPLPGPKLRPIGRPARSQSLYRLSYPGSCDQHKGYWNFTLKLFKTRSFTISTARKVLKCWNQGACDGRGMCREWKSSVLAKCSFRSNSQFTHCWDVPPPSSGQKNKPRKRPVRRKQEATTSRDQLSEIRPDYSVSYHRIFIVTAVKTSNSK